jgi:epoxyqueuosine reductase QueG
MDAGEERSAPRPYAADVARAGEDLREYVLEMGADLYGVAAAEDFAGFPDKPQPGRLVKDPRSVVAFALACNRSTMASVLAPNLSGLTRKASESFTRKIQPLGAEGFFSGEEFGVMARELSLIAYRLVKRLERQGHAAFHPTVCKQNDRFRTAPFSHTLAAHLAGLGTMGYNCCLLTPEYGPRVVLTSVITDRLLPAGRPLERDVCLKEDCLRCVEACPAQALDGKGGKNRFLCASYGCCGTCVAVCPVGRGDAGGRAGEMQKEIP